MKYLPEKCDEVRPKFFLSDPKGCTNVLDRFGSWMFFSSQRSLSSGCKVNPEAPLQDRKESRLKRQARFWASGRRLRFSRPSPPRSARPTKAVGRRVERFDRRPTAPFELLHIRIPVKFCQNSGIFFTILQKF